MISVWGKNGNDFEFDPFYLFPIVLTLLAFDHFHPNDQYPFDHFENTF